MSSINITCEDVSEPSLVDIADDDTSFEPSGVSVQKLIKNAISIKTDTKKICTHFECKAEASTTPDEVFDSIDELKSMYEAVIHTYEKKEEEVLPLFKEKMDHILEKITQNLNPLCGLCKGQKVVLDTEKGKCCYGCFDLKDYTNYIDDDNNMIK